MISNTPELSHTERAKKKLRKIIPLHAEKSGQYLRKPEWIRVDLEASAKSAKLKKQLRNNKLHTVCEEASCPNLAECFGHGIATFMIMGNICTRRCSFCDVAHGIPGALDQEEPENLAKTVASMKLRYVVITSVDRDDLEDRGASHFTACIAATRKEVENIKIEILVPDFRNRVESALDILSKELPDVFNHNIETAPRLYKIARPGSDYQGSLSLLSRFKEEFPKIPTKSGMMLGLGETNEEVEQVLVDLRKHGVDMLTLGQYLQPTVYHMPIDRYVSPATFDEFAQLAKKIGFSNVASGPMVRSSYHADLQAQGETVN